MEEERAAGQRTEKNERKKEGRIKIGTGSGTRREKKQDREQGKGTE